MCIASRRGMPAAMPESLDKSPAEKKLVIVIILQPAYEPIGPHQGASSGLRRMTLRTI